MSENKIISKIRKIPSLTDKDLKRFCSKIRKTKSCWIWNGSNQHGYGQFSIKDRPYRAIRVIMSHIHGDISDKLVCHTCDNRSCVNPKHLYLGTHAQNMTDSLVREKHFKSSRKYCKNGHLRSEHIRQSPSGKKHCNACTYASTKKVRNKYSHARNMYEMLVYYAKRDGLF